MAVKLAFCIHDLGGGGSERTVSNLSFHIPDRLAEKYIIVSDATGVFPYRGTLISLSCKGSNTFWGRVRNFTFRAIRLRSEKRRLGIGMCVSFGDDANFANILSRGKEKTVISVREHKSSADSTQGFYGWVNRILMLSLYGKADAVVVNARALQADLSAHFHVPEKKIKVIYNMVDCQAVRESASEPLDPILERIFNPHVLVTVGRLSRQKGYGHLIRVFRSLKQSFPSIRLVIVGEGESGPALVSFARRLGLQAYAAWEGINVPLAADIYFLGFQKNPFALIARSGLFVLTSLWEGFPNALVEAMACGRPVIACDCRCGPREILAPETDYLFQTDKMECATYGILAAPCSGDQYAPEGMLTAAEQSVAEGIRKILTDSVLADRYAQVAWKRAEDFDPRQILSQWLSCLGVS